ncbi:MULTISPECIES: acyl-CoA dehydrogenase family protein [unclassified Pseudonocardia]|uniref:acyl-CoA dehydrogenase family protein n=1 Tax=unclassified Pseudonocardia TaxID=2619320 RepID=UPI0001FFE49B|nr:acyl-CoA dehydrogenase family protein [Pseudonocardia sp. Ae707_Ps1]OLM16763.1 Butyryl-CoA dehydrogenase [Pseudonocardia sp. Ae707_Ps1]
MQRDLYSDDHELYRETVREFLKREVEPYFLDWERDGGIERSVFKAAATQGVYALAVPEEYGGAGETDYRFRMIVNEEIARTGATSFGMTIGLQDDLVLAYLLDLTTAEQKQRWLAPFAQGQMLGALAMTEPGTGSDLQGIRTSARRDGDGPDADWILDGQKTFISSAMSADFVIVAVRTDPDAGSRGFSLLVVEEGMEGFTRGRRLEKVGLHAQDTGELFFDGVRVPAGNLIGTEGRGMHHLMSHLPQERLGLISGGYTAARAVYEETARYCFDRAAFGRSIGDFQNTRFALAEMETELDVAEAYVDRCVRAFNADQLTPVEAAKGKWFITELQKRITDRCVQLHGGYGYMIEYPVARAYADCRIQTIYGGTTEIMKEIVGREIAGRVRP